MRRGDRRWGGGLARGSGLAWFGVAALVMAFPAPAPAWSQSQEATDRKVADIAEPTGFGQQQVQGVGLVIGLAGTGSDPQPGIYRQRLLEEIRRNPALNGDAILADERTSLVLVKGTMTAGLSKTDELNVQVELQPNSETTSLEGGFLMETHLRRVGFDGNRTPIEGKKLMTAHGPVVTGSAEEPANKKIGRVLGGGRVLKELPYVLLIGEKHRSGRVAKKLQELINYRFQYQEGSFEKGVATAKTDQSLVLQIPRKYHHNQLRYLQVIAQLRLYNTEPLLEQRLNDWGEELLDPKTAGEAALKLEGIGGNAAPVLANALISDHPQVRFFAAEALAYLDDPAGADELAAVARDWPEFRTPALAALASMQHPAGIMRLRDLMAKADPQVRYGAFNALRTADPGNPYLGRVRVRGVLKERRGQDPMALKVGSDVPDPSDYKLPEDPFELYVVRGDGAPLVHVSRNRRPEIVIFGGRQRLLPPVVLGGTGPILLNAGRDDRRIEIARIQPTTNGVEEQVLHASTDLVEVIRTIAALGATYPQVINILEAADEQANLTASFAIDAVPSNMEAYDQALLAGIDATKIKDEAVQQAGGASTDDGPSAEPTAEESPQTADSGQPSDSNAQRPQRQRFRFFGRFWRRLTGRNNSDNATPTTSPSKAETEAPRDPAVRPAKTGNTKSSKSPKSPASSLSSNRPGFFKRMGRWLRFWDR